MSRKTYYRNNKKLTSTQGTTVDYFSLWMRGTDHVMTLVDEDEYTTHPFDPALFSQTQE